jgi:hypothetical protein
MPNASPSSGRDTSQASRRSSNMKDPPWSRRVLNAAHAVQAVLQANNQRLQASIECRQFESQFAEFYSNWPRNEEYYTLLAECRQMRLALRQVSPDSTYSFLDILTTTLIQCTTRAEGLAYEDEHEFKSRSSPPLSSCAHAHSSDSTRLEAIQMSHKGSRSAPSLTNDEKVHEDKHWQICSSLLLSPHIASHLPDSMHPKAIHLGHQVLAQFVEVLHDTSPSTASLHPDVKLLHCVPVALPPVHGEVPSSVTKQMLEAEVVSKEEGTSTPEYSPVPLAALTLPKRTPILSIWAVSHCQSGSKCQPPPLVNPGCHGPLNAISPIQTLRINTRQATDPSTRSLTLNIAVH